MSYEYTDDDGSPVAIYPAVNRAPFFVIESTTVGTAIPNTEAPQVALEILKAGGVEPFDVDGDYPVGTVGYLKSVAKRLQESVDFCDELEKAERRDERRTELAYELGYTSPENIYNDSPAGRAIDRIIELEEAAK